MTTTVPAVSEETNLDAVCTAVTAEVARTDGKASLLLAFDGAVLAGLATAADTNLPAVTKTVGAMAVLALVAAAALLLFVVRPQLGGADRASFPYWADMDDHRVSVPYWGHGRRHDPREHVRRCPSRSHPRPVRHRRKYTRLRRAVDLSLAALALLLAAATSALV